MVDNHAEGMAEAMEVDEAVGGESINHQNSFEEKKALLEELERGGVEGVEDMAVEKCPACGVAWIEQLLNRSRWTTSFTLQIQLFFTQDCGLSK